MNVSNRIEPAGPSPVRADFVPVAGYISPEVVQLEKDKLWPRVWLMAARVEQFAKPGDFVTFNVADEFIIIVLNKSKELRAFYNVCQHRGRRLVAAESGNLGSQFVCGFHAWRYDLDGQPTYIRNEEDWEGCEQFSRPDLSLKTVRLETWAGWVWICMSPEVEPLLDYLAPIPELYRNYEFDQTRVAWHKTVVSPCNWKVVVDAFNESYHIAGTHPQMVKFGGGAKMPAQPVGRHTSLRIIKQDDAKPKDGMLTKSQIDMRKYLHAVASEMRDQLQAVYSAEFVRATERLMELPEDAAMPDIMQAFGKFHREEVERSGARWPDKLTDADMDQAGGTWCIFPNILMLTSKDGALWIRARPNGDDPDSCMFDTMWLGRFAPGQEPAYQHETFIGPSEFKGQNFVIEQDFANMEMVQKGMKSRGFMGSRTNPCQEAAVSHLHEVLFDYIFDDARKWGRMAR